MAGQLDPNFVSSQRAETQPLLSPEPDFLEVRHQVDLSSEGTGPDGYFDPGEDISSLNDRDVWRHFESKRSSAIFHLGRYLDYREMWRRSHAASSAPLDIGMQPTVPISASGVPSQGKF